MKIIKYTICIAGLILFLQNCKSVILIPADKRINLDQINLNQIEGRYSNNSNDTVEHNKTTFWAHLKPFPNDTNFQKTENVQLPGSYMKIKIIDKNKIQFSRYDYNTFKEVKFLKFKLKDGLILIKSSKNRRMEGIPGLFFKQHCEKLNIALDHNSNMVLSYAGTVTGGILIMIFGSEVSGTHTFIRK